MRKLSLTVADVAEISTMASRYLWWKPIEKSGFAMTRKIAQIMHLGVYEDIRRLEELLGEDVLAEVMQNSEPGWFDDRSWDFWRGRLSVSNNRHIDERRPKRAFAHAQVL